MSKTGMSRKAGPAAAVGQFPKSRLHVQVKAVSQNTTASIVVTVMRAEGTSAGHGQLLSPACPNCQNWVSCDGLQGEVRCAFPRAHSQFAPRVVDFSERSALSRNSNKWPIGGVLTFPAGRRPVAVPDSLPQGAGGTVIRGSAAIPEPGEPERGVPTYAQ